MAMATSGWYFRHQHGAEVRSDGPLLRRSARETSATHTATDSVRPALKFRDVAVDPWGTLYVADT
jgi:hypothetical protein